MAFFSNLSAKDCCRKPTAWEAGPADSFHMQFVACLWLAPFPEQRFVILIQ
jgi:hypothetical protein